MPPKTEGPGFKLRDYQVSMAHTGYGLLKAHGFAYNTSEERVGKTASTLYLIQLTTRTSCLILTKKAAVPDIQKTIDLMTLAGILTKRFYVTNYESAHKIPADFTPDIAILDEAHHGLSAYPKPSKMLLAVGKIVWELPLVYMSATPYSESYSQIYHQLRLSTWSPFASWVNFYKWHTEWGIPQTIYLGRRSVPGYKMTQEERIKAVLAPYFYGMTRKEAGFTEEAEDEKHFVELEEVTLDRLNTLKRDSVLDIGGYEVLIESVGAEMQKSYQLEGGTLKIQTGIKDDKPTFTNLFTGPTEKIDYIKDTWGDTNQLVIMYNYINEGLLLRNHFQHAEILQADKYAEGISLKHKKHLVIYSMSWRTSKHIQRRNRQADLDRKTPIIVGYLLCKDQLSEDIYNCVVEKKHNFNQRIYETYRR